VSAFRFAAPEKSFLKEFTWFEDRARNVAEPEEAF
jgi:hypothetical protein